LAQRFPNLDLRHSRKKAKSWMPEHFPAVHAAIMDPKFVPRFTFDA